MGRWGTKLAHIFNTSATLRGFTTNGDQERIRAFRASFPDVRYFASIDEMLSDPEITAIVIATPIATHYQIAKMALEHTKHVFVEKPLALQEQEVCHLIDLAHSNNRVLFSGYTYLYHPLYAKLKEISQTEHIEQLTFSWNKFGSFHESSILNLICHDVAICADCIGTLRDVRILSTRDIVGKDDIIHITASFGEKQKVLFSVNRVFTEMPTKSVCIETTTSKYIWTDNTLHIVTQDSLRKEMIVEPSTLEDECIDFLDKVLKNSYWVRADGAIDVEVARFFESAESSRTTKQ